MEYKIVSSSIEIVFAQNSLPVSISFISMATFSFIYKYDHSLFSLRSSFSSYIVFSFSSFFVLLSRLSSQFVLPFRSIFLIPSLSFLFALSRFFVTLIFSLVNIFRVVWYSLLQSHSFFQVSMKSPKKNTISVFIAFAIPGMNEGWRQISLCTYIFSICC